MTPNALPSTGLLTSAPFAPSTADKVDTRSATTRGSQAETLPNQFSVLVAQYSEDALSSSPKVDAIELGLKQPGEVNQTDDRPEKKSGPQGKAFSGTWQLLLDMLDSGFDAYLPVVQRTIGSLQSVVQKAAEELTFTDAATAQVRTSQQASPQHLNVSQAASVLDQVASAIVSAAGGSNRLVVRLHPPDLGTVTVKVTRADGKVSVTIETSDSSVQSILARGAGDLRDSLKAQGISVNRFDVTNGENHGEKDGRDGRRRRSMVAFQIEFASPKGE